MSILTFLSRHVTAADLQSPLGPTLSLNDNVVEAERAVWAVAPTPRDWTRLGGTEDLDTMCLVRSPDGRVTHTVTLWDIIGADHTVAEAAIPILPEDCVAGDTPALHLVKFFSRRSRPWALVLTGTQLSGSVSTTDLWKPEFGVCVFALLLAVEQQCAETLANREDIDRIWASLTPARQAKAIEVFAHRSSRPPNTATPAELVFCTTFADKPPMLALLPSFADVPKRQLKADFATMEKFRNLLAHTGESAVMKLEQIATVIEVAEATLKRLTPRTEPAIRLVKSDT